MTRETTVLLDGTATSDSDGGIVEYAWNCGNGRVSNHLVVATLSVTFTAGTCTCVLTATDTYGASTVDTLMITVISEPNEAPVEQMEQNGRPLQPSK